MTLSTKIWSFYAFGEKVIISPKGLAPSGLMNTEPITVIDLIGIDALASEMGRVIEMGNPPISQPDYQASGGYPYQKALFKLCKVGSWRAFERVAKCYSVYFDSTGWKIPDMVPSRYGGWEINDRSAIKLPTSASVQEVVNYLVKKIHEDLKDKIPEK